MMRYIFLSIFVSVTLISCEKIIPLDVETKKPKIVINSAFNSDSTWLVHISNSLSVIDNGDLDGIDGANVTITDETGTTINLLDMGDGIYMHPTTPSVGLEYTIDVSADDYTAVSASDVVPFMGNTSVIDTNRIRRFNQELMEVTIEIDDPVGANYYAIQASIRDTASEVGSGFTAYIRPNSSEFDNYDPENSSSSLFLRDNTFDGTTHETSILMPIYFFNDSSFAVDLNIVVCSKAGYDHLVSYDRYLYTGDDPFAQPVQVYSNVTNGFGIFAGMRSTYETIDQ